MCLEGDGFSGESGRLRTAGCPLSPINSACCSSVWVWSGLWHTRCPSVGDGAMVRRRSKSERGAELVEVSLVLPLVLLVSVGVFEFGRGYGTWQVLTNAAREGAREATLPSSTVASSKARALYYLSSGLLNANSATVTVDQAFDLGAGVTGSQVTITYPFSFMVFDRVARLIGPNPAAFTMTTSTTMRNESQ